MKFLVGKGSLSLFFYTPMFLSATIMGGTVAYLFLVVLKKNGMLLKIQQALGTKTQDLKGNLS